MVQKTSSETRAAERDVVEFLRVYLIVDEQCIGAVLPTVFSEADERRYGGKWGLIAKKLAADEEIRIARSALVFKTENEAVASAKRLNEKLGISDEYERAANRNHNFKPQHLIKNQSHRTMEIRRRSSINFEILKDIDNLAHYILFSLCAILSFLFTLNLDQYQNSFDLVYFVLDFAGNFILIVMFIYAAGFAFSVIASMILISAANIFGFDPQAYRSLKGFFDFFVNPITGTVFFLLILGAAAQFLGFGSDGCNLEYTRGGMTC